MGISVVVPLIVADAPVASDNDSPAAPNIGAVFRLRFRFECCFSDDTKNFADTLGQMFHRIHN
jgi:hypothetical protein